MGMRKPILVVLYFSLKLFCFVLFCYVVNRSSTQAREKERKKK